MYFTIINEKCLEYKRKVEDLVSKIDRTKETILDLEQGALHNSREIRKMLENANIEYITGEEYLKKQEEKYQQELLEKNPLLPYCYIVTKEDLDKIKQLEIREEVNKLAPIITYQNIDKNVKKEKQIVQIEEIYFLSLYHKECFSTNANEYKQKLEKQLQEYKKRKDESEKELQRIEGHIHTIEEFKYQEDNKKEMEQELVYLETKIQDKKEENINSKEQRNRLQEENEKRKQEIEAEQVILANREQEKVLFLDYLENDANYCEDIKRKQIYEKEIMSKKEENKDFENKIEIAQKQERENIAIKNDLSKNLDNIKEKQLKIPKREKQEILNSSLEELEARYEQLTQKYQQDRKHIDEQIIFWSKTRKDLEKEKQKDYGDINLQDYELITYSEEMEDLTKEKKEEEEKELEYKREEGKKEQNEYTEQNKKMQKQINEIERNVDVKNIKESINKNELKETNLQELISEYKALKHKNQGNKENIYKKHLEISTQYRESHRIIKSFLENVSIENVEEGTFDSYYYIYEKMLDCVEKLKEYIGILNMSLQNIEQDKKNILQHAVKQGTMLYQEMKKISESSKIKIGTRYVQILKIDIPQELKEHIEQRIENHIQQCIQDLREECKQSENIRRMIESKVAIYLSDRQLLNLTLDLETIKVKLYKFDIENKNSGLRQWEDVIVGNSGGQKFIACFALISALIEYTRRKELENLGEDEKVEASKVFILDNPFGKTSSKHLLEPMLEISKKFNIQMICLSDLSQSSITDKFTLIYQLALRSSKYTNNSFLNIEDFRVNGDAMMDTSLEQVYLRSNVEQISFLN